MRTTFIIASIVSVSLVASACVHQQPAPASGRAGAERSIFPVVVFNPHTETMFTGKGEETLHRYSACTGVFIAPHLMVTSATVFPQPVEGSTFFNVDDIDISDGDFRIRPVGVIYEDRGDGIALIRTAEAGSPISLNGRPYPAGDNLVVESFIFTASVADGRLLQPEWNAVHVAPAVEPYAGSDTFARFRISAVIPNGSCGAPVLDEDGTLAGIVHERHRGWSSVISAAAIRTAITTKDVTR
jgi:hypothetical protein